MDKKISLARQEEVRRSVLLSCTGTGTDGEGTLRGEARAEDNSNAKGNESAAQTAAMPKRKSYAASARGNGRGIKSRLDYQVRDSVRDAKRRNTPIGRSAKELGIEWIGARCEESPVSKAHYLVARTKVDEGCMWECVYCHRVKWLPITMEECCRLNAMMNVYGLDGGYQRILELHPAAKRMLCKIQDIYYLKKKLTGDLFAIALSAIMLDKEYPYDVEEIEEEML